MEASPAWLAFAASVTFGPATQRYRRLQLDRQVQRFAEPVFFSARAGRELLGIYVLDKRRLLFAGCPMTGYYRALFAVREDRRGEGIGTLLAGRAMEWIDAAARLADTPILSYGCIASDNAASLSVLTGQGGVSLGTLTSRLLYRQWPRASQRLTDLIPSATALPIGQPSSTSAVDVTRCDLPLLGFVDAGGNNDGAGAVRLAAHVGISAIAMAEAGAATQLALRVLVRPWRFARRRFDPESLTYLRISHLYVRPDCTQEAEVFLQALLARFDAHYALLVTNSGSVLESILADTGLFHDGIGRHFLPAPQRLRIMGRWHGGREEVPEPHRNLEYRLMPVDL